MTLDEIRARRKELRAEMDKHRLAMDHIRVDLEHLYLECPHPNKYTHSTWGRDTSTVCPDCGWSE